MSQSEMDDITADTTRAARRAGAVVARYVTAARLRDPRVQRLSRSDRKRMQAEVNQILREERRREKEEALRLRADITQAISAHQQQVFAGHQPRPQETMDTWFTRQQGLARQRHELERYIQTAPGLSQTERGSAVTSLRAGHFMPAAKAPAPFAKQGGTAALRARVEAGLSRLRTGLAAPAERLRLSRWEQTYQERQAKWSAHYRERAAARAARENPLLNPYAKTAVSNDQRAVIEEDASSSRFVAEISYSDNYGRVYSNVECDSELAAARWVDGSLQRMTVDDRATLSVSVDAATGDGRLDPVYRQRGSQATVHAEVEQWRDRLEDREREDTSAADKPAAPREQTLSPELLQQIETMNRQVDKVLAQNLELRGELRSAIGRVDSLTEQVNELGTQRDRYKAERDEAVQKLVSATPAKQRYGRREQAKEPVRERQKVGAIASVAPTNGHTQVQQTVEEGAVQQMVGVSFGKASPNSHSPATEEEYEVPVIELTEEEG